MSDAAEVIETAMRARAKIAPIEALADAAAGYAAQRALAGRLGAVPPAGFKIGATARAMQEYLGIRVPVAGFVMARDIHASPARLAFAGFVEPGVECEIAVRLAHDLPPAPCTRDQAEAAVGEVFPAIEIVERRYADMGALHTPTVVADRMFHRAGVLGAPVAGWRGLDLGAVRGSMTVGGRLHGEGVGADLLGHPMEALAWLAGSEGAAAFGGLRAGQVVWLGSVTPPAWLEGPGAVVVEFEGLGRVEAVFA
ncbi:MAG TPA: fumarylacetoacetate hydrolase family protein [Acetobacteraceae bacterium]|nr:fumarylacetoacetate hydrolase family protein [Acetobacteraceae bacterium]